ncbi:MAG: hypothetical protein RL493_922, partial [Pseudomonadota bacterium]
MVRYAALTLDWVQTRQKKLSLKFDAEMRISAEKKSKQFEGKFMDKNGKDVGIYLELLLRTAIKYAVISQPGISNIMLMDHAFLLCGLPAEGNISEKIMDYVNGKFTMRKHLMDYLDREAKCAYFLWQKEVASPTFDGIALFKPLDGYILERFTLYSNSITQNKIDFIADASLIDPMEPRLSNRAEGPLGTVVKSIKQALDGDTEKRTWPGFVSWVSGTNLFPESASVPFPPIIHLVKCLNKMGLINMRLIENFAKSGDTGKTTLKELISPRAYAFILTFLSFTLNSEYDFTVMNFRDSILNDDNFISSMKIYTKLAKKDFDMFAEEDTASDTLYLHVLFQMIIYSGIFKSVVDEDEDAGNEEGEQPAARAVDELDTFLKTGISLISIL